MEGTTPTPARWGARHTTRIPPNVHAAHAYREPGAAQGTNRVHPVHGRTWTRLERQEARPRRGGYAVAGWKRGSPLLRGAGA
ncbi:unnamed protein product [Rangifer tarandus platyrhynchus]|uniref:Uncharacterized protein n=1 Tax=Rangifer tarandus platyrhynchus TaxID=3082113 RepID=A0ABN8YKK6_RANTA|nr:unnamed protein product [Rangifer tarandus platyrhynchus]